MATFATLQGMRVAPRDPSNPLRALSAYTNYRDTNALMEHGMETSGRQGPEDDSRKPWGAPAPNTNQLSRSMTARLRERGMNGEGAPVVPNSMSGAAVSVDELQARKREEELRREVEELRRTVSKLQVAPLRESVNEEFFDRLQQLKREHESNLRVIERLYRDKREAERRAAEMEARSLSGTRAAGPTSAAPSARPRRVQGAKTPLDDEPHLHHQREAGGGGGRGAEVDAARLLPRARYDDDAFADVRGAGDESMAPGDGDDHDGGDAAADDREADVVPEYGDHDEKGADGEDRAREEASWTQRVRTDVLGGARARPRSANAASRSSSREGSTTKPRGFIGMETAGKVGDSITKRKAQEYLESVRRRDEEELSKRPVPHKIPETTRARLFDAMRSEMEAKRQQWKSRHDDTLRRRTERVREQQAREDAERRAHAEVAQFKARDIPAEVQRASVTSSKQAAEAEEKQRRERVAQRSAELLARASMPPRMEMWERQRRAAQAAAAKRGKAAGAAGSGEGHDGVSSEGSAHYMARDPPDFARLHDRWSRALEHSKRSTRQTAPKVFKFMDPESERAAKERARMEARAARERAKAEEEEQAQQQQQQQQHRRRPLSATGLRTSGSVRSVGGGVAAEASFVSKQTRAMEMRERETQRLLEERRHREALEKKEGERRRERQELANKRVAPLIRTMHDDFIAQQGGTYVSLNEVGRSGQGLSESARAKVREKAAADKARAAALAKVLQEKTEQAPSLVERFRADAARVKARQTGLMRVASTVHGTAEGEEQILAGRMKQRDDDLWEEEEKVLAEAMAGGATSDHRAAAASGRGRASHSGARAGGLEDAQPRASYARAARPQSEDEEENYDDFR